MSANCSQPSGIANGYMLGSQVTYDNGTQVHYVCNSGYTMSGSPTLTCYGATWYGTYPTCSLSFLWDIWFWLVIALLIMLATVLTIILIFLCIKYICCKSGRRRRGRVDDGDDTASISWYEDELGIGCCCRCCLPCCLTCCWGCCSFYNCCGYGGCCGRSCRCCFVRSHVKDYGERRRVDRSWEKVRKHVVKKKVKSRRTNSLPSITLVTPSSDEINSRRVKAKELPVWKPHTHPVRLNNQSTY